jgi:hypothetical protein
MLGIIRESHPMDKNKLTEIRALVEQVINSNSKSDAKPYIARLELAASHAKSGLDSYFSEKLSEVVNYAKDASGQVKNKEHWISCMESSWYVLESHILDE